MLDSVHRRWYLSGRSGVYGNANSTYPMQVIWQVLIFNIFPDVPLNYPISFDSLNLKSTPSLNAICTSLNDHLWFVKPNTCK